MNSESMKDLVAKVGNALVPIRAGELFEVKILQVYKTKIIVDVGGYSLGLIPEPEFSPDVTDLKVGDKILAYVLNVENDQGYTILSLKRADKERITKVLEDKFSAGDIVQVKAASANKGGLICHFGEFEGFLPVSQLATSHYPKVASGDREEIFKRLKKLVGQLFRVKVLSFDPSAGKLIFSEKAAGDVLQQEKIQKLKIGQKLTGEITGIVNFGLFVKVKLSETDEIEGLIHISEVSWDHIADLTKEFTVGQKIEAEVISVENNRLSLSLKRLLPDPWLKEAENFKKGQQVEGTVTKITPFGAFVKVGKLDGLVHISELGDKVVDPHSVVEEKKNYKFEIISIEPELHKLSLSMNKKEVKEKEGKVAKPAKKTKAKSSKKISKSK